MTKTKSIQGILPIAHTPFTADDQIDYPSLLRQIDWAYADGVGAQQMPAAQHMLEETEEEFDRPAVLIDVGNHLSRDVEQIGCDPQNAVARRAGGAPFASARLFVGRSLHENHADRMVGPRRGLWLVPRFTTRS